MGAPVVNRWLKVAGIGCLLAGLAQGATAETKPALLFCTPQGPCYGWLDLNYANELHAKGFEVDCTETLDDVTWNRIKRYHVLVIYITPDAMDVTMRGMKPSVEKA